MKRLAAISAKLASVKSNRDNELRELLSEVVLAPTLQLPLSPYMVCAGLNVDKCRVLGSAKAPLWLEFTNAVVGAAPHVVIFKTGDDLRQAVHKSNCRCTSVAAESWLPRHRRDVNTKAWCAPDSQIDLRTGAKTSLPYSFCGRWTPSGAREAWTCACRLRCGNQNFTARSDGRFIAEK